MTNNRSNKANNRSTKSLKVVVQLNLMRYKKTYGLGSGCYAEPRVGESIRSKYNVRNKLAKTEDRLKECEPHT